MNYSVQENSTIKLKDSISTRIGYYWCFLDDMKKEKGNSDSNPVNREEVYSKIIEHIFEHVGDRTSKDSEEVYVPDYQFEILLGNPEKRCVFNFYITWLEEEYFEIEYGDCKVT